MLSIKPVINDDLKAIGDIVEQKIGKALEPIKEKLDNHTASLMKIEQTLAGYEHLSITPQK